MVSSATATNAAKGYVTRAGARRQSSERRSSARNFTTRSALRPPTRVESLTFDMC